MRSRHVSRRHLVLGTVMLPLSMLPFAAYGNMTPEGRLLRDRAVVAVAPPSLPDLPPEDVAAIEAAAPAYEGGVMALVYHGVGDVGGGSRGEGRGHYTVEPERFAEHLVALEAAGLQAVTAADVASARAGGPPLPARAVMISFDDGRSDALLWADPLLAEAGMAATMSVISSAAESRGVYYARWPELRDHARSGRWDIQAHTDDLHRMQRTAAGELPALTSLADDETLEEYRTRIVVDLDQADRRITNQTGAAPVAFAYPFGAYGADRTNDPRIRDVLAEEIGERYEIAFHQDDQDEMTLVGCGDRPLELRRLDVEGWTGPS